MIDKRPADIVFESSIVLADDQYRDWYDRREGLKAR